MKDKKHNQLTPADKHIKQALEHIQPAYRHEDWLDMRKRLDSDDQLGGAAPLLTSKGAVSNYAHYFRWLAAAILLIAIGSGYLYLQQDTTINKQTTPKHVSTTNTLTNPTNKLDKPTHKEPSDVGSNKAIIHNQPNTAITKVEKAEDLHTDRPTIANTTTLHNAPALAHATTTKETKNKSAIHQQSLHYKPLNRPITTNFEKNSTQVNRPTEQIYTPYTNSAATPALLSKDQQYNNTQYNNTQAQATVNTSPILASLQPLGASLPVNHTTGELKLPVSNNMNAAQAIVKPPTIQAAYSISAFSQFEGSSVDFSDYSLSPSLAGGFIYTKPLSNHLAIGSGIAFSYRSFIATPRKDYALQRNFASITEHPSVPRNSKYTFKAIEVPILLSYSFYGADTYKKFNPFIAAAWSISIPVKERYKYVVTPYLNAYSSQVVTSNSITPIAEISDDAESDNERSAYLNDGYTITQSALYAQVVESTKWPLKPKFDNIQFQLGSQIKLSNRMQLACSGIFRTQLTQQAFDRSLVYESLTPQVRLKCVGVQVALKYDFY